MAEREYFFDLAEQFGVEGGMPRAAGKGPGAPGSKGQPPAPHSGPEPGKGPAPHPGGQAVTHPNVWRKEKGLQLLQYLKEKYQPGNVFDYDGHADCWLMLAVMDQLRACDIEAYMGPPFEKHLKIEPYQIGGTPPEKQPFRADVEEKGKNVLLTITLKEDSSPFALPFSQIVVPEIPEGKNIYVRLAGRHLLFLFPLSLTYGDKCRTLITDYAGECFCSVSHTPDIAVGDLTSNPFTKGDAK